MAQIYNIKTAQDLRDISDMEGHYILCNDIDLLDAELPSIGFISKTNNYKGFQGVFDGAGFTISNFTTTAGFFAHTNGAVIKNLNLINANVIRKLGTINDPANTLTAVGIFIGIISGNTSVDNCFVKGNISTHYGYNGRIYPNTGGFIGEITGSAKISDCGFEGKISVYFGGQSNVDRATGGFIGTIGSSQKETTITRCYADIDMTPDGSYVGGFIGHLASLGKISITECFSEGSVERRYSGTAGFIAYAPQNYNRKIENCFSLCDLNSNVVSKSFGYSNSIKNSYSASNINMTISKSNNYYYSGYILGGKETSINMSNQNCYFDLLKSRNFMGAQYFTGVEGHSTWAMSKKETYKDWDFENIWTIDEYESYPYLRNVKKPRTIIIENNKPDFAGGTGTIEDPFQIDEGYQLKNINSYMDKHFVLIDDIDMNSEFMEPIGFYRTWFEGSLNGNFYKIKNLNTRIGLFYYVAKKGSIKNLILTDALINYTYQWVAYIGTLASQFYGTLENCFVEGDSKIIVTKIRPSDISPITGGLVGYVNTTSEIKNCGVDITFQLEASTWVVGGLFGQVASYSGKAINIKNCYAKSKMILINYRSYNNAHICSFIGDSNGLRLSSISECYAEAIIIENSSSFGTFELRFIDSIVHSDITIENCYAHHNINVKHHSTLRNIFNGPPNKYGELNIKNCYLKAINGGSQKNMDKFPASSVNCYFDSDLHGSTLPIKNARTTLEMKTKATYEGWDFDNVWAMDGSYPYLRNTVERIEPIRYGIIKEFFAEKTSVSPFGGIVTAVVKGYDLKALIGKMSVLDENFVSYPFELSSNRTNFINLSFSENLTTEDLIKTFTIYIDEKPTEFNVVISQKSVVNAFDVNDIVIKAEDLETVNSEVTVKLIGSGFKEYPIDVKLFDGVNLIDSTIIDDETIEFKIKVEDGFVGTTKYPENFKIIHQNKIFQKESAVLIIYLASNIYKPEISEYL